MVRRLATPNLMNTNKVLLHSQGGSLWPFCELCLYNRNEFNPKK